MNQLFMRLKCRPLQAGAPHFRIVNPTTLGIEPERFADSWAVCCESINGGLWTRERFEQEMRGDPLIRDDGILFAETGDGDLISTVSVQLGRAYPYVDWDYARSSTLCMFGTRWGFSGRGVGLAVCRAAIDYSLRHGADTMYLTTDNFRLASIKIYLKLGFLPVLYDNEQTARWRNIARALEHEIECVIP